MTATATGQMREFLMWVDEREPTHAEASSAWQTSCPRLSVWEDAQLDGLVVIDHAATIAGSRVRLSDAGRRAHGLTAGRSRRLSTAVG